MAFCKNCGTQVNDGTKFCPKCGQAVDGEPQQQVYQQPQYAAQPQQPQTQPLKPDSNRRTLKILLYIYWPVKFTLQVFLMRGRERANNTIRSVLKWQ